MKPVSLSRLEARRVALLAQGFPRRRSARAPGVADLSRTIRSLGLLQLDYVNVLVPAHLLVLFSRLGPWDVRLFDELYRTRAFTEQWAHEASLVPVETWPLLRYRRDSHRVRPYGFEAFLAQHESYVSWVLEHVRDRGPVAGSDLPLPDGVSRRLGQTWFKSVPRAVLEAHFGRGALAVSGRRSNFARTFDLAERVLPAEHHSRELDPDDARRTLLLQAARAHGVGTTADLADYFRMPVRDARPRLLELAASGALLPATLLRPALPPRRLAGRPPRPPRRPPLPHPPRPLRPPRARQLPRRRLPLPGPRAPHPGLLAQPRSHPRGPPRPPGRPSGHRPPPDLILDLRSKAATFPRGSASGSGGRPGLQNRWRLQ